MKGFESVCKFSFDYFISTIRKNEEEYRNSLAEQKEIIAAKEKEVSIIKSELKQLSDVLENSKNKEHTRVDQEQKKVEGKKKEE